MMASSSALSTARKQQTSQETDEAFDANVARSASFDDFARQQFFKNRKLIIRNVPRVTYDVRMNELIDCLIVELRIDKYIAVTLLSYVLYFTFQNNCNMGARVFCEMRIAECGKLSRGNLRKIKCGIFLLSCIAH